MDLYVYIFLSNYYSCIIEIYKSISNISHVIYITQEKEKKERMQRERLEAEKRAKKLEEERLQKVIFINHHAQT